MRRNRYREGETPHSGSAIYQYLNGTIVEEPVHFETKFKCFDTLGPHTEDGDFHLQKWDRSGQKGLTGSMETSIGSDHGWAEFSNCLFEGLGGDGVFGVASYDTGLPPYAVSATHLLANTNPSKPEVIPLSVWDSVLRFPKYIKESGDMLLGRTRQRARKQLANAYLGSKFGLVPLINDLREMIDIMRSIEHTKHMIDNLSDPSGKGYSTNQSLGQVQLKGESSFIFTSGYPLGLRSVKLDTTSTWRRWGSVRWKAHDPSSLKKLRQGEKLALAAKIASGITADATFQGAWDLIPWSFIMDWGFNLKDYVGAHANTIPCYIDSCCVMEHERHESNLTPLSLPEWVTGGGGTVVYESKKRISNMSPSLSVYPPAIDGGKLATLGALAAQRLR